MGAETFYIRVDVHGTDREDARRLLLDELENGELTSLHEELETTAELLDTLDSNALEVLANQGIEWGGGPGGAGSPGSLVDPAGLMVATATLAVSRRLADLADRLDDALSNHAQQTGTI